MRSITMVKETPHGNRWRLTDSDDNREPISVRYFWKQDMGRGEISRGSSPMTHNVGGLHEDDFLRIAHSHYFATSALKLQLQDSGIMLKT